MMIQYHQTKIILKTTKQFLLKAYVARHSKHLYQRRFSLLSLPWDTNQNPLQLKITQSHFVRIPLV